jgi:hypothetical protein
MATKEPKSNLFDRFIDQFSARELKSRVWVVVLLGFILCGVSGVAGWWLLTHQFYVSDEPGMESVKFIDLLKSK